MDITRKNPEEYGIQRIGDSCHRVVKILAEYDNHQDAVVQLTKLLVGVTSEEELIKKTVGTK